MSPAPTPPANLIIPPPIGPPVSTETLDLSRPPPGFGIPSQNLPADANKSFPEIEMPYYNLPAGLMVPLVKVSASQSLNAIQCLQI